MKTQNYFLGLDIGTDSIGYAAVNEDYELLKFKGEPMWGVTVFEAANQSAERRSFRVARRRLDRRQQRVRLVDELFAKEIAAVDPKFFVKKYESALWREDASEDGFALDGTGYENKYPTIHHLIVELMHDKAPHDVRLVYWACAWLVAHRGHFLSDVSVDNIEGLFRFDEIYYRFLSFFEEAPWNCDPKAFSDVLRQKKGVTAKEKAFYDLLFEGKKPKKDDAYAYNKALIIKLLCGGKAKATDLYKNDEYSEIPSFSLDTDEDVLASDVLTRLGDDSELILNLKAMFDWAILVDARRGKETISEGKVAVYEQHKADLAALKRFVRKYLPQQYNDVFRKYDPKTANYTAYVKNLKSVKKIDADKVAKAGKDAFSDYIKKLIEKVKCTEEDEQAKQEMITRLETRTFLPKQIDSDNRIIPYQLYLFELKQILKNASAYLPFLSDIDEEGLSIADKLISVFTFRVPYFVGPLTGPNNMSSHAWIVRKAGGRILPWNFEETVDLDKSEKLFIDRMVNRCTYLPEERVLPKNSLLYNKFAVLNEINNIRINGEPISVEAKQNLFTGRFANKKRITRKAIEDHLLSCGIMHKGDVLEGIDITIKASLGSYHDFKKYLSSGLLREEDVERIIERRTYTEDSARFRRWIDGEYPALSDEDRRYVSSLKYADFGRLSQRFLNGIEGCRKEEGTGELHTIMYYLWETNDNLMQILSDRYTFAEEIDNIVKEYYGKSKKSLIERLDDMYVSNAVKRPIIRMEEIAKEIVKVCGHSPKKIFVEMARGASEEQKGKRTVSRADQIRKLYASIAEDTRELSKQLDAMGADAEQKLRSESLFLYYTQLGRCMYTGERIDITKLKTDGIYNIDHIYPRCFVKDDSVINNKVLVLSKANSDKGDLYPVPEKFRKNPGVRAHWDMLHKAGLISDEKYYRLTRAKAFTDDEKTGFINRQLVETRQSTKVAAEILKEMYPDTEIVYVKAGLVSEFRHDFDMLKCRSVNDLHHAKDAYLNVVVGNVYNERFGIGRFNVNEHYNAQPEKLFGNPVTVGGRRVWNGGQSIARVRKVMHKNTVHFSRYAFCRKGGLFDQMPLRAKSGLVPRKARLDTTKYGGYSGVKISFFILAKYNKGSKKEATFVPIELMAADKVISDEKYALEYVSNRLGVSSVELPLGLRPIKINSLFEFDGMLLSLGGYTDSNLSFRIAAPCIIGDTQERYVKRLEKYAERAKLNKDARIDEEFDEISKEKNTILYDLLSTKLAVRPYTAMFNAERGTILNGKDKFDELSIEAQALFLLQLVALLKTGRASSCDLSAIGGSKATGIIRLRIHVSVWKNKYHDAVIIDRSPAGLFEKRSINLLDLV